MTDLLFPLGGLNDSAAVTKQGHGTSPDAVNVQGRDPSTLRMRGGSREGTSRVTQSAFAASVRQIAAARFDASASAYAIDATPTIEWNHELPQRAECRNVKVDNQGNVFALDGRAGVAMYNKSGELVWKFVLPVKDSDHICRALDVDEAGSFYVGVSEGGDQKEARLFKFTPRTDGSGDPIQEWEIQFSKKPEWLESGAYVEDVAIRQGTMVVGLNRPDIGKSEVVTYRLIDTGVPEIAWRQEQAPFPLNALAVREKDGAVYTAHEANATRGYDLRAPDTQAGAEDATPEDFIADHAEHLWCDLDADDVDGDDSFNSNYRPGELVRIWRDKSGNNRSVYETSTFTTAVPLATPPTLDKSGRFGGHHAISFGAAGADYTTGWNELVSYPNSSTAANGAPSQRTCIPGYTGADFSFLIVLRTTADATPRGVWGARNSNGTATWPQSLYVNSSGMDSDLGGFAVPASGSVVYANVGNAAGNASPTQPFDSTNGWAIIVGTCLQGATDTVTITVNGSAQDSDTGLEETLLRHFMIGSARVLVGTANNTAAPGAGPFSGSIARFMCWDKVLDTTERQKLEGWAAWRFGLKYLLPGAHPYDAAPPTTEGIFGGSSPWDEVYLSSPDPLLVKWDPNAGRPRWVVNNDGFAGSLGGIGYGVAVPKNGSDRIFSTGPKDPTAGGTTAEKTRRQSVVRCLRDGGSFASVLTTSGTWEAYWGVLDSTLNPDYTHPKLGVSGVAANDDLDGTGPAFLYVPYHTSATGTQPAVYVYDFAGDGAAGVGTDTAEVATITLATGARGYAAACGPWLPEYEPGLVSQLPDRYVAIGTVEDTSQDECVALASMVTETKSTANPAGVYAAGFAGAVVSRIQSGGLAAPSGDGVLPAAGSVFAAEYRSKLYIVADGTYLTLDSRANRLLRWRSKSAGALPVGSKLVATWGDRIALAGSPEEPFFVTYTAIGDPEDCDLFPVIPSGAEAARVPCGDAVTGLIPLRDDLMLIGCQSKLLRQTGNPARGGQLDAVSDVDGVAWGEAWCKDAYGSAYIFHGQGGVTRITTGADVRTLTDRSIRRRLEGIDLSTRHVRLVWNHFMRGLMVVPIPQPGQSGSAPWTCWFWEAETGGWWEWELGFVPTAVRAVHGSSEVWFGTAAGRILKMDAAVDTDDGELVAWRVTGGPLRADERRQVLVRRPRFTLAGELAGARAGLYGGSEAEIPDITTQFADTSAGLGRTMPLAQRGANVWWRLSGVNRFAYEGGDAIVEPFGIRRAMVP